jgi:gliding motility-associated lipoprotein GldD
MVIISSFFYRRGAKTQRVFPLYFGRGVMGEVPVTLRLCVFAVFISFAVLLTSCHNNDYMPKPRGYFRIDFPAKEYRAFDTTFPFTFEYPRYATILPDKSSLAEPYWINIIYTQFHAQLHISYKVVNQNLGTYLEDVHTLVDKHIPKANAIAQRQFINKQEKVYGLVYDIKGSDAASACQFYLTDSTSKFVRGALYFNLVPNNDSLAPVITFLKDDIEHMINSFRWKKTGK